MLVSWIEPAGEGKHTLKFARIGADGASAAKAIATRDDFFVNFADFPSIVDANGVLFAHWLQKSGKGTYAYDVRLAASRDAGATWSDSIVVHDDGVPAEHGFASLVPLAKRDAVGIVWLDGRNMTGEGEGHDHEGQGDMMLRYAEVDASLAVSDAAELDARTCECCTTTIAMTTAGPIAAYRDRSADEVRDIGVARLASGEWKAEPLSADGWKIHGCPVNGPQADARGDAVAVAWFTIANDRPRVRLAFSHDAGSSFGTPLDIAEAPASGYVDCVFIANDRVAVTWLEDDGAKGHLRMREITADGTMLPVTTVATTTRGRTGFPRLAMSGTSIFVVWNEKGDSPRIHLARAAVAQ
ncbi:MAG: hypothetical protein WC538_13780 [Thermoanaerobaculia bacterium]